MAVLADGMGGHVGGARASKMTCGCFLATYPKIEGAIDKRLLLSLDASNKTIESAIEKDQKLFGMGCTLLGVCVDHQGVHWVSVGDSLLYLFHNKKLTKLNEDHSLAPCFGRSGAARRDHHQRSLAPSQAQYVTLSCHGR